MADKEQFIELLGLNQLKIKRQMMQQTQTQINLSTKNAANKQLNSGTPPAVALPSWLHQIPRLAIEADLVLGEVNVWMGAGEALTKLRSDGYVAIHEN